jgi:hypothetical protein
MKRYVHARLGREDREVLERLKRTTGRSESDLLRRGLYLVAEESATRPSALALAGRSAGRFRNGPRDLSTASRHLEGFGT